MDSIEQIEIVSEEVVEEAIDESEELEVDSAEEIVTQNIEKTFCEQTTYLEFLLSNAKDEEEAEHIKATINNYLGLYDEELSEEDDESLDEDVNEEETTE
mgnify:CR=1 FL=1